MYFKRLSEEIENVDCTANNTLGLCTSSVEDVFDITQFKEHELIGEKISENIIKKISFSVPILGEIDKNNGIFRFNGDLSILEKLKPQYKQKIFDENNNLKPGIVQIDSNDTVQIKIGSVNFTFVKRSDYHLLQNPYGETLSSQGEKGKIYRDTASNFITETFLKVFKMTEKTNPKYLDDFNNKILKDYIVKENKYNQIITENSYSNFDEFYKILLEELPAKLDIKRITPGEIKNFLKKNESNIKKFYDRTDNDSYKLSEKTCKNIPLQLFVDLLQNFPKQKTIKNIVIRNRIISKLQIIYNESNINAPDSIISKLQNFANKENLNEIQVSKLLVILLSAHDPHTALEHSIEMANNLQLFLKFIEDEKHDMKIFGKSLTKREKEILAIGFILHDIGKLFISAILLRKKGNIFNNLFQNRKEKEHIDKHVDFGKTILELLQKYFSKDSFEIIKECTVYHHLYDKINSSAISDIIIIFDIVNARISERSYEKSEDINTIVYEDPKILEKINIFTKYFTDFVENKLLNKTKTPLRP